MGKPDFTKSGATGVCQPYVSQGRQLCRSGWLPSLAAITFLPIGYVISIFSQVIYLKWREWFERWRNLRRWLSFHGAVLDSLIPNNPDWTRDETVRHWAIPEPIIESRTLLLTASRNGQLSVNTHRYIRGWIARRMDVVAIDISVISATFLVIIFAFVFLGVPRITNTVIAITSLIITVLVIIALVWNIIVLRRQVIEVIAGIYRTYR